MTSRMKNGLRVVTWNCRRATADSPIWDHLLKLKPDVALLQEVISIPDSIRFRFACDSEFAMGKNGSPSPMRTVILVRGYIGKAFTLTAPARRAPSDLIRHFQGNLFARHLLPENGPPISAVSVYGPAWPINRKWFKGIDVSDIGLNGDVWVTDLLYECLEHMKPNPEDAWIVGGDFNLSETFDEWSKTFSRGNSEYLKSMKELGLVDGLRDQQGKLTPTFRHSRGTIKHQMDHLFTTAVLTRNRIACNTGSHKIIFGKNLSDHLPIVADFRLTSGDQQMVNLPILGAIAGDIIGSVYEWDRIKHKDFPLFIKESRFTDDTVMTVAIAEEFTKQRNFAESMQRWGRKYPNCSYGARFGGWLHSQNPQPYNSYGNGSAMRVSAAGCLVDSLEETLDAAKQTAEVTHNHPEGIKGAQATAAAIFLARTGRSKEEIRAYIQHRFRYNLNRTVDDIRPTYGFDETCQGTVPEALIAFLDSTDYEDAIRNAVSLGGDSDTLACITGGIAAAYYGIIPEAIVNDTLSRLPKEMRKVIEAVVRGVTIS